MKLRSGRSYESKYARGKRRRLNPRTKISKRSKKASSNLQRKIRNVIARDKDVKVTPQTISIPTAGAPPTPVLTPSFVSTDFGTISGPTLGTGHNNRTGSKVLLKGIRLEPQYSHGAPQGQRAEDIQVFMYIYSTAENSSTPTMWFRNNEDNTRVDWADAYNNAAIGKYGIVNQTINTDEIKIHWHKRFTLKARNQFQKNGYAYAKKHYVKINKQISFIQDVAGQQPGLAGVHPRIGVAIWWTWPNATTDALVANTYNPTPFLLGNTAIKWYWQDL